MRESNMSNEEAILRIQEHIDIHKISEANAHFISIALKKAIRALENEGCGCGICLAHNNMQCPRVVNMSKEG